MENEGLENGFTKDIDSERYPLVRLEMKWLTAGDQEGEGEWARRWGWVGCAAASGPRIIGS